MAGHSTRVSKGFFGGWVVKCSKCGKLGTWHFRSDAQQFASRHH